MNRMIIRESAPSLAFWRRKTKTRRFPYTSLACKLYNFARGSTDSNYVCGCAWAQKRYDAAYMRHHARFGYRLHNFSRALRPPRGREAPPRNGKYGEKSIPAATNVLLVSTRVSPRFSIHANKIRQIYPKFARFFLHKNSRRTFSRARARELLISIYVRIVIVARI